MRKFLCIILIILLLASYSMNLYAQGEETQIEEETSQEDKKELTEEEKAKLEELQTQNKEIQQQIEGNINQLGIVQEELTQNLIQIQEVDNKIAESEEKINILNDEISVLDKTIRENENDIKEKQKEYDAQKRITDARLIAIYEKGETQYLEVLLGSKTMVEFISNYYLISELHKNDIQLLEKTSKQRDEIKEKTKEIEEQRDEINEKRKKQQTDSQLLENAKTARQIQVSQLSEQEQNIQAQIDEYKTQVNSIEQEIRQLSGLATFGEDYVGEPMIWPIPGHTIITSPFGMRTHPITGLYRLHTGTDVSATIGTDFLAMASGIVVKAEYNTAYGNMVIIDHGGGVQTLYAHGSEIVAKIGQQISQGETVLKVGSTGYSTGPHAHFEIRINGEPVNPLDYVEPQ